MSSRNVLALYRKILRLHSKLPENMRQLGVAYTRDEFKRHKDVKDEWIAKEFVKEWQMFASMLEKQAEDGERFGKKLDSEEMDLLSEEQLRQLEGLFHETKGNNN